MRSYSIRLKSLSLFLIASLIAEQLVFAAPDFKPAQTRPFDKPTVDLRFPESVASVEDAWNAGAGARTIYLFQDAHANYSGQLNLSRALDRQCPPLRGHRGPI